MKANTKIWMTALTALILLGSCSEKLVDEKSGSTDVLFRIGLSGRDISVEDGPWTRAYVDALQFEKDLHTLRVIVATGPKKIIYNEVFREGVDFTVNMQDGQPDVVLKVPNVPYGRASFYVIANEKSLWGEEYYTTDNILAALENSTKIVYTEPDAEPAKWHFPRTGRNIEQDGLPMSGSAVNIDIGNGMEPVEVKLERSVVKLSLTFKNSTGSTITLGEVSFGKFFGNSFNMFREYNLDVPDGIVYSSFEFNAGNIDQINTGESTNPLSLYLYPTHAYTSPSELSPYTLGIETNVRVYPPQVFTQESYFIRNHQVNIKADITTTGLEVSFEVGDWESWTADVPSFD